MKAVICGCILGVVGSRASEGASGLGVAKTVDVCVKKNLVRTHVIALQDGCKSVVGLVEAKVAPVVCSLFVRSHGFTAHFVKRDW